MRALRLSLSPWKRPSIALSQNWIDCTLNSGKIDTAVNQLSDFINEVQAQRGKHITIEAANLLIADAQWVINDLKLP
jgi:hypothetical protein